MICEFKNDLVRAYAIYIAAQGNPTQFITSPQIEEGLKAAFSNPDVALEALKNYIGEGPKESNPQPIQQVEKNGAPIVENINLSSYYTGGAGFARMLQNFKREILRCGVLDIKQDGTFEYVNGNNILRDLNITEFQRRMLDYKRSLLNKLCEYCNIEKLNFDASIDNDTFTHIHNQIISEFESRLDDVEQNSAVYDAYVVLKEFDNLINKYASYITIDKSFENIQGVIKYEFDPGVEHFSGFTKEENVNILSQISNLASTILELLPDVGENGILQSMVGLSGFNGAMQTLKTAIMYTSNLGEDGKKIRKKINQGAVGALDPKFGLSKAIDLFIEKNKVSKGDTFGTFRQLYLHNKLRAIQRFLLSKNTPKYIQNIFVQLFLKTEDTGYRVYEFAKKDDSVDESEVFEGKNLKSKMIARQKFAIEQVFIGGLNLLNSSKSIVGKLLEQWSINIDDETITVTNKETGSSFIITSGITTKSGDFDFNGAEFIEGNDQTFKDFILSVYSYIIPDTYDSCVNEEGFNWRNDFAPFVAIACKRLKSLTGESVGIEPTIYNKFNNISLYKFNKTLLNIGKRLGIIYGDSIKNTIKGLSGNSLPLYQLTSLEYNWRVCLDDAQKNKRYISLFKDDEDLLLAPCIRSEIALNGQVKSPTKLSANELNKLGIIDDFLMPVFGLREHDSAIYIQNATFSDKARQFLAAYKLDHELQSKYITSEYGKKISLRDIIIDILKTGDNSKLLEATRVLYRDKYTNYVRSILTDFQTVFPEWNIKLPTVSGDAFYNALLSELKRVDELLKTNNFTLKQLRKRFDDAHISFKEEIHAYQPKVKGRGDARINETLLKLFDKFCDQKRYSTYMNFCFDKFVKNLKNVKLHGFDVAAMSQIKRIREWNGGTKLANSCFYNETTKTYSFIGNKGEINPIIQAYFAVVNLLSNEFNSLTIGEVFAHPNKNKSGDTEDKYLEFSEANRLVNQVKRSVIFGSTIHPFGQDILDEEGYECGVTKEIEIGIFEDEKAQVQTPNGDKDEVDGQDGAGWCTALESNLENNSLVDSSVGSTTKKTILHDIDHQYGKPTLLKWAVTPLTNALRRSGFGSKTNAENLTERMYGKTLDKGIDYVSIVQKVFNEYNKEFWIKDRIKLTYKKIQEIQKISDDVCKVIYDDGTTSLNIQINTLYNIDQIFGGCWTYVKAEDGSFIGSESSVDLLTRFAIISNTRHKQVAYVVNASACKVGIENLNSRDAWRSKAAIKTFKVATKYAGVMMDAEHDLDDEDVSEMTQMISALIEDGHYTDFVTGIYQEIGEIALKNAKMSKIIEAITNFQTSPDEKNRAQITEILGESLINAFNTGNRSTLGLAQAFVKKAERAFKKAKLNKEIIDYVIPFSDPTIFGAFMSNVTSMLSKDAIRRRYQGLAGVQTPSFNVIQYFKSDNGTKLYETFEKEIKNQCFNFVTIRNDKLLGFASGEVREYNTWQELALNAEKLYKISETGEIILTDNPYWKVISTKDVDFEDTLMIQKEDGTFEEVYVNSFKIYDEIKHLGKYDGRIIYLNQAAPRNLRGTDTKFDIVAVSNGITQNIGNFSLYEIDSVRASQYLNEEFDQSDPFYEKKKALILKVFGEQKITKKSEGVEYCKQKTADFLEQLDLGKDYQQALSRGETPNPEYVFMNHQECFGEIKEGVFYYSTNYNVRPAEIIMGRYQLEKLGFGRNDHLHQVKDYTFFKNKLRKRYEAPKWNAEPESIKKAYDYVIYHNGTAFLVKIGDDVIHGNDGLAENVDGNANIVGNDLRYGKDIILSNETKNPEYLNNFRFSKISDGTYTYNLITVKSKRDYYTLYESHYFDRIYRHNNYIKEDSDEDINKMFDAVAHEQYDSFQQAIKYIGARVPTQAMQSYSPFEIIAFMDTDVNQIFLPAAITYLHGSDYNRVILIS